MTKEELLKKSQEHQDAIERELQAVASEGKKIARTSAYVAGGLLAAYVVVRLLTRDKSGTLIDTSDMKAFKMTKPNKTAGIWGGIGKFLLTEAAMIGMEIAKNRIKDALKDDGNPATSE
jgi:hypothetical protein